MIALRFLALCSFAALLTACGGTFCPEPMEPKFENHTSCWYSMKVLAVKNIDDTKSLVTATIPEGVGGDDTDHKRPYSFFVNNPSKTEPLKLKSEEPYLFIGGEHSPYLELYVFPSKSDDSMRK